MPLPPVNCNRLWYKLFWLAERYNSSRMCAHLYQMGGAKKIFFLLSTTKLHVSQRAMAPLHRTLADMRGSHTATHHRHAVCAPSHPAAFCHPPFCHPSVCHYPPVPVYHHSVPAPPYRGVPQRAQCLFWPYPCLAYGRVPVCSPCATSVCCAAASPCWTHHHAPCH